MHPRSKDRRGNAKLIADVEKQLGMVKSGPGGEEVRRSKYGARLAELRARAAARVAEEQGQEGQQDRLPEPPPS